MIALSGFAQSKIEPSARLVIDEARRLQEANTGTVNPSIKTLASFGEQYHNFIVELEDETTPIDNPDIEEIVRFGNTVLVRATASKIEELARLDEVKAIGMGNASRPLMNNARRVTNVDPVHQGSDGLPQSYTGRGVVVGLMDQGLDVNHINFLNEDELPRTKAGYIIGTGGLVTSYETEGRILNMPTDDRTATHGTHVLGIMAGSYNGPADYIYLDNGTKTTGTQTNPTSKVPFYGVAKDADLVVSCGSFNYVSTGVGKVVDYMKKNNRPGVVNLSLGNNVGPHDGSDAESKFYANAGKDAIICISAGNEGGEAMYVTSDYSMFSDGKFGACIDGPGIVDIWASDNRVFTMRLLGYKMGAQAFSYNITNLNGSSVKSSSMPNFSQTFGSMSVTVTTNINPSNNRYNAYLSVSGNAPAGVYLAFEITPADGQKVDAFSNSSTFSANGIYGLVDGTDENSINGLACGENVLVVGSFCSQNSFPYLSGGTYSYTGKAANGAISNFSSYGTTFDGRQLPDVCGPGEVIISSLSRFYTTYTSANQNSLTGMYKDAYGETHGWGPMQGTSMSSPFVAGVVATWLEADPSLTIKDVKDIINATATNDVNTTSAKNKKRFGAGKINALAGLKEVLVRKAGVNDVVAEADKAIVTTTDGRNFDIFVNGARNINAALYSLSGVCVAQRSAADSEVTLRADNAAPGVYVMRIDTDKGSESQKVVIK